MPRHAKGFTDPPHATPLTDDTITPASLRAQARLLAAQQAADARITQDVWTFCTTCVQTIDQVSGAIRPFPKYDYLKILLHEWQQHKLLLVAKSRRMFASWTLIAAHYWLARYTPHAKIAFMARKEGRNEAEGSAELVWRAKFIHDHMPAALPPLEANYQFCRLTFPNGSEIIGLGEGADQARQMTLTAVLGDEVAFWDDPLATYIALRPTIDGGGRITLVSSAAPGFFKALVHDELPA
jgi:hypothetical protein